MAQLTFDLSGKNGLATNFWGDFTSATTPKPERRYIADEGQMVSGYFNAFEKHGYLCPALNVTTNVTVDSTTYAGGVWRCSLVDAPNGDFYVGSGQYIYKASSLDASNLTTALDLGAGGTPNILDFEVYQINGAAQKLFAVYETGGNTEIAISNLPYDTATDNLTWLSGTVTGSAGAEALSSHAFLRVADNGFMYLFRDNRIDKIDGTSTGGANGTITNNVLLFPFHFRIADAVDYRGNIYVALHNYSGGVGGDSLSGAIPLATGIYVWDRQSAISKTVDYLPLDGVKRIFKIFVSTNGKLRLITENASLITEIREWNGYSFQVLETLGRDAHPQYHDGLFNTYTTSTWLASSGKIISYGGPTPKDKEGVHLRGYTVQSGTSGAGAVVYSSLLGDRMYLTYDSTTKAAYYGLTSNGDGNATKLAGNIFTPVKFLPYMSTVKRLVVYMRQETVSSTATAATLKIYFNGSSSAWASKTITRNDVDNGYYAVDINKSFINSIQLEVVYPVEAPIAADFNPTYAVIDYEPTKTLG